MGKITPIGLSLALLLLACQQQPIQPYHHSPTGISFPDFLGEMKRGEVFNHEKTHQGLGLGIKYNGPSLISADIYVYNLRLATIPDDVQSQEVMRHFSQAEGDLYAMEKRGAYRSVQKVSEGVDFLRRGVSSERALSATFSYIIPAYGVTQLSHLYLAVYKNHFIKIRFSYSKEQETEGKRALLNFLDDFGRLLNNKTRI